MRGKKNSSAVKQHPVLMLHSIPGGANSKACKEQLSWSVSPYESCCDFLFFPFWGFGALVELNS